ncbi:30S ribosomal protein S5, partial [Neisseria meningitidis]
TIHHEVIGRHGATKELMQPAKEGSGVKAGGPMRLVLDAMGIHNISAKVHGPTNPYNIVRATLHGLSKLHIPADIAAKRGLTVE